MSIFVFYLIGFAHLKCYNYAVSQKGSGYGRGCYNLCGTDKNSLYQRPGSIFGINLVCCCVGWFCCISCYFKNQARRVLFFHSFFGKILGVTIFVIPFAIKRMQAGIYFGIVCVVAGIAAIESIIIQSKSKEIKQILCI